MGVILTAGGIADAVAPWLIGHLRDTSGAYTSACFVLVGFASAGRPSPCFRYRGIGGQRERYARFSAWEA